MTNSDISKFLDMSKVFPEALLVGGTVRNSLLTNCQHSKSDIDLLIPHCDLTALQYLLSKCPNAKLLASKYDSRVRAMLPCGTVFDLSVTPLSITSNAAGRDFTINSMSLNKESQLLDPLGAKSDISRSIIRTCGDPLETLLADPARIVRALRFKSQLSVQTGDKWQLDIRLALCLSQRVNTLVSAIRATNQSAFRNEVLKLLSCAPASVLYKDLREAPDRLVAVVLEHAEGKLTLR